MDILPLYCVCTVTVDQFLKCLQRRARREEADTVTAAEKQGVPSFSNCVLLPVRGTSVVFDVQRTCSTHSSSTVLFSIMCRSYGLDTSGALLTCVRIHLAEWKSGYEASCEATMDLLGHSPFLLSLLSTFLTNKVRDELVQVHMTLLPSLPPLPPYTHVISHVQVCPYDYERIQFVLGHVLQLSEEREQPKEDYEKVSWSVDKEEEEEEEEEELYFSTDAAPPEQFGGLHSLLSSITT